MRSHVHPFDKSCKLRFAHKLNVAQQIKKIVGGKALISDVSRLETGALTEEVVQSGIM